VDQDPADLVHPIGFRLGHDGSAELDGPLTDVVGAWLLEAWPFEAVRYR
jgi:hypothetical protein